MQKYIAERMPKPGRSGHATDSSAGEFGLYEIKHSMHHPVAVFAAEQATLAQRVAELLNADGC